MKMGRRRCGDGEEEAVEDCLGSLACSLALLGVCPRLRAEREGKQT